MQRFDVKLSDGHILKLYFTSINEAKNQYPDAKITENNDYRYLKYIEKIQSAAVQSASKEREFETREVYKLELPIGTALVRMSKDNNDGVYYDFCEYQIMEKTDFVYPIGFIWSNPQEFVEKYMSEPLKYELVSYRVFGEPKLTKPKELKGIKQSGSVDYIPDKCKCQYFILGDDVYMKHRDYFSLTYCKPEDIGTPLNYRLKKYGIEPKKNKFVYDDCWGAIVLRNEAWIKLSNLIPIIRQSSTPRLLGGQISELQRKYHKFTRRLDMDWNRFWEELCGQLNEIVNNEKKG